MTADKTPARGGAALAFLLWAIFVVYGSLLPFAYTPKPTADAWATFLAIPTYSIGQTGRADWLANLLIYIPLAFLAMWALDVRSWAARIAIALLVATALGALAGAVEFLQIFFPPRTVSANDLVAEGIGIVLGVLFWFGLRRQVLVLAARYDRGGSSAARVLMLGYAVLYVVLALIPFDFLLSFAEFAQKDTAAMAGWWVAPRGCTSFLPCSLQLVAEALFATPLGIAVVVWRRRVLTIGVLVLIGVLIGTAIELAQLLLASGVTQGASVLAKTAGVVGGGLLAPRGLAAWRRFRGWHGQSMVVALTALCYVILLTILLGLWRDLPLRWEEARLRLNEIYFLPLYYYYYTSETRALVSLLVQVALFMPLGILLALAPGRSRPALATATVGLLAGTFALAAQAMRLFHPPQRPDLTDVLIAIVAAVAGYRLMRLLARMLDAEVGMPVPVANVMEPDRAAGMAEPTRMARMVEPMRLSGSGEPAPEVETETPMNMDELSTQPAVAARPSWPLRTIAFALAAILAWSVVHYPLNRVCLGALLLAYAAIVARWPTAWYVLIPAALPVADLAGWSGRLWWSEFDRLILVTLMVACWRGLPTRGAGNGRHFPATLLLLVAVSVVVSFGRGAWPLEGLDANAFATYTGHFNALRIAKGLVWAVLLCLLARREGLPARLLATLFACGLALGAAAVIGVVVWERLVFTGLFNFAHEYRVTGPFWEMNTGGAYIEGYLVATLPFIIYVVMTATRPVVRIAALGVFAGGIYAVLVTMSRNGFAALAVSLAIMCAGLFAHYAVTRRAHLKGALTAFVVLGLAGVVAVPILTGATLRGRFATVAEDFRARTDHWTLALELRGTQWADVWLGAGLGRFPDAYFWGSGRTRPSSYRFMEENNTRFLRLGGGESLYFEQFVDVEPRTPYTIELMARTNVPQASFTVPVCEKWMLSSFECAWQSIDLRGPSARFAPYRLTIDSGAMAKGTWYTRRPVRFALYNATHDSAIDVTNVRLIGPDGVNRVANGDFADGMDHWHFSTDSHLPWHVKSMPVQILFDHGWFGVLAWGALTLFALARGAVGLWRGDLFATASLAGLIGFLVVGLFDSMIDTPRLLLLFGLLLWLTAAPRSSDLRR